MRRLASLLFLVGLALLALVIHHESGDFARYVNVGLGIDSVAPAATGAANIVTSVVLAYRGFDTLVELSILFAAATVVGLLLGDCGAPAAPRRDDAGFVLRAGADLAFPLLLVVGLYIVAHGHLTPGGGFQGGVVLACAFFVPLLARADRRIDGRWVNLLEGLSGAAFVVIGLVALAGGREFLAPWLGPGRLGELFSAGTLPLLYLAVGLKVGAELAGVLARLAGAEAGE